MGFCWPRTIAITTAITLHGALLLWASVAGVGERAEPPRGAAVGLVRALH